MLQDIFPCVLAHVLCQSFKSRSRLASLTFLLLSKKNGPLSGLNLEMEALHAQITAASYWSLMITSLLIVNLTPEARLPDLDVVAV